jgi:hypothetical protein
MQFALVKVVEHAVHDVAEAGVVTYPAVLQAVHVFAVVTLYVAHPETIVAAVQETVPLLVTK